MPDHQKLAEAIAEKMYALDAASRHLGIRVLAVAPGFARVEMRVSPEMLNAYKICHGGLVFALADSAFAYACTSSNVMAVASGCSIEFLVPAHEGDLLTAEAKEMAHVGRSGVYDIVIGNQNGHNVALFRGRLRRVNAHVIPPAELPGA